ncbi:hypothetical protein QSJ18_05355 [Gordonia sp. ABSL1-1]|uniref:hypothetical protein n=1 Tax=Gordonia sp. ABSL1-1 TaxID=3053923 RepID=UPI00257392E9|nr:hypothetical protein [Gordonia sp. ABSL1-1]MDL9936161.1 hypothetical protein [Gordonia sp. ABSL1-1]
MNDGESEQPYSWSYSMWLLTPPDVDTKTAWSAVKSTLMAGGWEIRRDDHDSVAVGNRDGFGRDATVNAEGDISLSAWSPCFPKSQLNRDMYWPPMITKQARD